MGQGIGPSTKDLSAGFMIPIVLIFSAHCFGFKHLLMGLISVCLDVIRSRNAEPIKPIGVGLAAEGGGLSAFYPSTAQQS